MTEQKEIQEIILHDKVYTANSGARFIVIKQESRKVKGRTWQMYLIQFEETGSTRWVYSPNLRQGKVRDFYQRTVYGVGYLGENYKKQPYWRKGKELWRNMLKRCYTDDPKGYMKLGITVDARWHCLETFLDDIKTLDGFDNWLEGGKRKLNNYNLDKDLKVPGSKVYSKDTCSFVHESINKAEGAKATVAEYYRTVVAKG